MVVQKWQANNAARVERLAFLADRDVIEHQNILVLTDFSELSRRALRAANQWVSKFGGHITPLHVYKSITDLDGFHFYGRRIPLSEI